MGESSTCLLRSFSQPCPTPQESIEEDPIRRALTSSVSLGRFFSESFAWEKWSSFSQKRYLEEAEKFSRPGSVAEKKAYFEAHYKQIAAKKAAALLEQQCSVVPVLYEENRTNEIDDNSPIEMALAQESDHTKIEVEEMQGENMLNTDILVSVDANRQTLAEARNIQSIQTEGAEQATEYPILTLRDNIQSIQTEGAEQATEYPILTLRDVKSSNSLSVDMEIHDEQEVKTSFENPSTLENSVPLDKNETSFSSGKPSSNDQGSKIRSSIKPNIPIYPRKWNHASHTIKKKTSSQSLEKKISTPQALHMSISFTPRANDTSKTSSPASKKIVDSGLHKPFDGTFVESSNRKTLTRASVTEMPKHLETISQLENGRAKSLLDQSVSISQGRKSNSSLNIGNSTPVWGSKVKSSTVFSSFSLRSEERAAKRKEFFQKLEQKMNSEAEKEPVQSMQKGKAKGGSNDVWRSVSSLAEANANFCSSTKLASIATKKIPTQYSLPKIKRKLASEVQDNNSRPPWRFSMKSDSFSYVAEKNSSRPVPKKSMLENTCPNIQL